MIGFPLKSQNKEEKKEGLQESFLRRVGNICSINGIHSVVLKRFFSSCAVFPKYCFSKKNGVRPHSHPERLNGLACKNANAHSIENPHSRYSNRYRYPSAHTVRNGL